MAKGGWYFAHEVVQACNAEQLLWQLSQPEISRCFVFFLLAGMGPCCAVNGVAASLIIHVAARTSFWCQQEAAAAANRLRQQRACFCNDVCMILSVFVGSFISKVNERLIPISTGIQLRRADPVRLIVAGNSDVDP